MAVLGITRLKIRTAENTMTEATSIMGQLEQRQEFQLPYSVPQAGRLTFFTAAHN